MHGLVVGAGIPLIIGLFLLIQFWASLAPMDDELGYCGMGSLPAILILVFGTPIGSLVGMAIGAFYSRS